MKKFKLHYLIYLLLTLISLFFIFLFLTGCETSGWLKPVKWKYEKTPIDLAVDRYENGLKYEKSGDVDNAMKEYEAAQKISPRPVVYYRMGIVSVTREQYDSASTYFQKALDLNPGYEEAKSDMNALKNIRRTASQDTTSK